MQKLSWQTMVHGSIVSMMVACANNQSSTVMVKARPTCKPAANQSLQIVGGVADSTVYPTTVKLTVTKAGQTETCTGTFISDDLVLTAGHCLSGALSLSVSSESLTFSTAVPTSTSFTIHPDFKSEAVRSTDVNGNPIMSLNIPLAYTYADIGIARFPAGTAPSSAAARFATKLPLINQEVFVVGYGAISARGDGVGTKRYGKNTIAAIYKEYNQMLGIVGPRQVSDISAPFVGAVTQVGDSGGALYNVSGEIIGTLSGGIDPADSPTKHIGTFTNIFTPKTQSFLEPFKQEIAGKMFKSNALAIDSQVPTPNSSSLAAQNYSQNDPASALSSSCQ